MSRSSFRKLLLKSLNDPSTCSWVEDFLEQVVDANKLYLANAVPFFAELHKHGIEWDPHTALETLAGGEHRETFVKVLLDTVHLISDPRTQATTITHLIETRVAYDATKLIELFQQTESKLVRDAICRTIGQTTALNADVWAREVLSNPAYGNQYEDCRTELCFWAAGLQNKEGLADLVMSLFDEMPLFVPYPLGQLAEERHLEFMRDRLAHVEDYPAEIRKNLRENLEMAIRKAEKRLAREAARKEKLALKEAEKKRLAEEKQRVKDERGKAKSSRS